MNIFPSLNKHLEDPYLNVMEFLNEVTLKNPGAISFAPGRPDHKYFNLGDTNRHIDAFVASRGAELGKTREEILQDLGQYNKTKGIINNELSLMLKNDEGIEVSPDSIVVTNGAQEAMIIILSTLCNPGNDIILVSDPSYIGFTGFAKIFGLEIVLLRSNEEGIDLDDLESKLKSLKAEGKQPKIVYDIPDFHNPSGTYLPAEKRKKLLSLADQYNFFVVEDNPYGMFVYEGEKLPTIKALDKNKRCIYIGSFSKTLYPSLRVGYIVSDYILANGRALSDEFTKVKSLTSVNTSSLVQAIIGGILAESGYSLRAINEDKIEGYKEKWTAILKALETNLGSSEWCEGISWNRPAGGFFLTLTLPVTIDAQALNRCVTDFSVIFCPMSMFYLADGGRNQIRLSFSYLSVQQIETGIFSLAEFLKKEITASRTLNHTQSLNT